MATLSRPPFVSPLKRWNADDDGVYVLNRGDLDTERRRLEYNHHHIWLPLCGTLCPPAILDHLRLQPSPRVAEIATGTGIWLRELAPQLPASAELLGIDMDTTKFPPPPELPANVKLTRHNALRPFPEDLRGTFDVVHVRLISLGMKEGDWEVLARNLYTLLRPGGYLHWEEVGDSGWRVFPPSKAFDEWMRIGALWAVKVGRDPFMPSRLPLLLKDLGFENVDDKIFSTFGARDMLREAMRKVSVEVVRPIMSAVLEDGGIETMQTAEDLDRLEAEMKRDMLRNEFVSGFNYHWVWGRRP